MDSLNIEVRKQREKKKRAGKKPTQVNAITKEDHKTQKLIAVNIFLKVAMEHSSGAYVYLHTFQT